MGCGDDPTCLLTEYDVDVSDEEVVTGRTRAPIAAAYCDTCGLFHGADVVCGVAKAAVEASIMVAGEVVSVEEIGDVDFPALGRALALRGLALRQVSAPGTYPRSWRVVKVAA